MARLTARREAHRAACRRWWHRRGRAWRASRILARIADRFGATTAS